MATSTQRQNNAAAKAKDPQADDGLKIISDEKRKVRMAALARFAGLWANRQDIPADALVYERELRNEWR